MVTSKGTNKAVKYRQITLIIRKQKSMKLINISVQKNPIYWMRSKFERENLTGSFRINYTWKWMTIKELLTVGSVFIGLKSLKSRSHVKPDLR